MSASRQYSAENVESERHLNGNMCSKLKKLNREQNDRFTDPTGTYVEKVCNAITINYFLTYITMDPISATNIN